MRRREICRKIGRNRGERGVEEEKKAEKEKKRRRGEGER